MRRFMKILSTNSVQRGHGKDNYIIVINSSKKKSLKLGKNAVVKYLFFNEHELEVRTITAIGKVVIDDSLKDDEVALDQTIRNAIGIEFGKHTDKTVKIEKLNLNYNQRVFQYINSGRYLFLRVTKPDIMDIEKNYCRVSNDVINVLSTKAGMKLRVENAESELKSILKKALIESVDNPQNTKYISQKLNGCKIPEEYKKLLPEVMSLSCSTDVLNILEYLITNHVDLDKESTKFRIEIYNYIELIDWLVDGERTLKSKVITVFPTQLESAKRISHAQGNQEKISLYERYPVPEDIFKVDPDLDTIHLDKYYRDIIGVSILDNVKVKRYWIDLLKSELLEYGFIFILTVFTAVVAITPSNIHSLPLSIVVALSFTSIMVLYRSK